MKFIFKVLVLVGIILVGKFLKEDTSSEVGTNSQIKTEDAYSLNNQERYPSNSQTKNYLVPTTKKVTSEETFTYSFN
ncbi:hypothetical protein ACD591_13430 [Rufibacter glacialis]|uniref:Uncharacterized protein n=1 Tax=Rufibacter glacialis TaxID=1259555 RepID=A0A5M8Q878_9BACT|nr:hypothetical protein FOE74_18795 [Rufibacter glacialis]GGK84364.1 hypothetical protein GCM10011405_35380 [Rufibacter glacialis]